MISNKDTKIQTLKESVENLKVFTDSEIKEIRLKNSQRKDREYDQREYDQRKYDQREYDQREYDQGEYDKIEMYINLFNKLIIKTDNPVIMMEYNPAADIALKILDKAGYKFIYKEIKLEREVLCGPREYDTIYTEAREIMFYKSTLYEMLYFEFKKLLNRCKKRCKRSELHEFFEESIRHRTHTSSSP